MQSAIGTAIGLENVDALAEVDETAKDRVEIHFSKVVADKEESKKVKYV